MHTTYGSECGKSPVNMVPLSLMSCHRVAKNTQASVPPSCCTQFRKFLAIPDFSCTIFLYPIVKGDGMKPVVAITIPKRYKFANFHTGKKYEGNFISSCIFISSLRFTFSLCRLWIISSICAFLCWCCVGYIVPWIEQQRTFTLVSPLLQLILLICLSATYTSLIMEWNEHIDHDHCLWILGLLLILPLTTWSNFLFS